MHLEYVPEFLHQEHMLVLPPPGACASTPTLKKCHHSFCLKQMQGLLPLEHMLILLVSGTCASTYHLGHVRVLFLSGTSVSIPPIWNKCQHPSYLEHMLLLLLPSTCSSTPPAWSMFWQPSYTCTWNMCQYSLSSLLSVSWSMRQLTLSQASGSRSLQYLVVKDTVARDEIYL